MTPRRDRLLRQRVRALERQVAELRGHAEPQFKGALLTPETLRAYYDADRARGVRFLSLRVHPALAEQASEIMRLLDGELRAILDVREQELGMPECGWKLVARGR